MAVEWRWYNVDDMSDTDDSLVLRHITNGGPDPVIGRAANPGPDAFTSTLHGGSTRREQQVRITITPDLPGDAANDTRVVVEYFELGAWRAGTSCGGAAPACTFAIATGERYHFGRTQSLGANVNINSTPVGNVSRMGLCP
mgnify:FL=1